MSFATSPLPYSLSAPPLLVAGGFRRQFSGIFSLNWLEHKFVLRVPPFRPTPFFQDVFRPEGSYFEIVFKREGLRKIAGSFSPGL